MIEPPSTLFPEPSGPRISSRRAERIHLLVRLVIVALVSLLGILGGAQAADATAVGRAPVVASVGVGDTLPEPNPFIPEDRNLSDCLSSLPKPGCGSEARGGALQFATFGILMLGMAFIGWRVFRSVKRRDDAQTPT